MASSSSSSAPAATPNEIQLSSPPTDGITTVVFANRSNNLLASSWDRTIRLYDTNENKQILKSEQLGPVLDCDISSDDQKAFSAGLDCSLQEIDLTTEKVQKIGSHKNAIRRVGFNEKVGVIMTGSWDETVCMWDTRSHDPLVGSHDVDGRVFAMCISDYRLVAATSNRQVFIFDVRSMDRPEQIRSSSLKHQTRDVKANPDGSGYILSSIEGRVAVEFFDPDPQVQSKKYAFKCHRSTDSNSGVQTVYPVNSIAFHPIHGTFATAGCDGVVNIWDGSHKKRICQLFDYATSLSSIDFNADGTRLAIAVSYTFENGVIEHPDDSIVIRSIQSYEVQPKAKKR